MEHVISDHVVSSAGNNAERAQLTEPREGVVQTWIESTLGVAEETVRAGFGLIEDVRAETQDRVSATLDWVEGFDRSGFRVARKALARLSSVGTRAIAGGEQSWLALLGAIRRTSRGATGLAFEATASVVGDRRSHAYPLS